MADEGKPPFRIVMAPPADYWTGVRPSVTIPEQTLAGDHVEDVASVIYQLRKKD